MKTYTVIYSNGITRDYWGMLLGAKRSASEGLAYGVSATIFDGSTPLCTRKFWSSLNRYGWDKWADIV